MVQAVEAYRSVSASDEFRELERLRDRARRNEASALRHARVEVLDLIKQGYSPAEVEEKLGIC